MGSRCTKSNVVAFDNDWKTVTWTIDFNGQIVTFGSAGSRDQRYEKHSMYTFMQPFLQPLYKEVVANLAQDKIGPVSFRWFCDPPEKRREMAMLIRKVGDNCIQFDSVTVDEQDHDAAFLADLSLHVDQDAEESVPVCAMCNRFWFSTGWLEPEEYYKLKMYKSMEFKRRTNDEPSQSPGDDPSKPTIFKYTYCPPCTGSLRNIARQSLISFESEQARRPSLGPNILIVDSHPANAMVVESIVQNAGCSPVVSLHPSQALHLLRSMNFDVVIVAYDLNKMTGLGFVRQAAKPGRKIVGISNIPSHAEAFNAVGADGFLAIPFGTKALKELLRTLVPSLPGSSEPLAVHTWTRASIVGYV